MARVKNSQPPKVAKPLGVADGFDFETELIEEPVVEEVKNPANSLTKPPEENPIAESDGRTYSKYYTPQPRRGKKGGVLGHPPVNAEDRKIQFSVSCTQREKKRYQEAAKKDNRKLPDFVNTAIREYIENHRL